VANLGFSRNLVGCLDQPGQAQIILDLVQKYKLYREENIYGASVKYSQKIFVYYSIYILYIAKQI
jgi:hypothetical protein